MYNLYGCIVRSARRIGKADEKPAGCLGIVQENGIGDRLIVDVKKPIRTKEKAVIVLHPDRSDYLNND